MKGAFRAPLKGILWCFPCSFERNTPVLSGNSLPPIQNNETCSQIVVSKVKDVLKVNISAADISAAHRLSARKNANQKDVIIKFGRLNIKTDILTANFFFN